jgi:hypothetical protein
MTRKIQGLLNSFWGRTADDGEDLAPASQTPEIGDNYHHEPLTDRYGRLWVRVATNVIPTPTNATGFYQTAVLATSGDIKATPGCLIQVWGFNTDSTNLAYFQLFDETVPPPAPATVPLISIPVQPNNGTFSLSLNQWDFDDIGNTVPFDTNGIEWAVSTTAATFTASAAPFWVNAIYV